ncbi:hypothetical protein [Gloeobacter morelensis]|uniref:Uncharacterized protein n=1 Tax=Gloeobacter morelensis MG652769 TaxID=2781736 RepID=A0ABY3PNU0_9CYAN|nr:hypothetical protein [Gloeobacter morelensis]UFP95337.1 hypothetical protein ISF26_03545 [Gloeobacter morelensis MG652769]
MTKQTYKISLVSPLRMSNSSVENAQHMLGFGYSTDDGYSCLILAELDEDPGFHTDDTIVIDNFKIEEQSYRIRGRVTKRQKWLLMGNNPEEVPVISTHILMEAEDRDIAVKIARLFREKHPGIFVN